MRKLYFAYGSNLNKYQMERRCPGSEPITSCKLKGHKMVFKTYCDVIKSSEEDYVEGAIYSVSENDIKALDRYEGFPSFYIKKQVTVYDEAGNKYRAFIYVMNEGYKYYNLPSQFYFDTVKQGFIDWNLNILKLHASLEAGKEKVAQ